MLLVVFGERINDASRPLIRRKSDANVNEVFMLGAEFVKVNTNISIVHVFHLLKSSSHCSDHMAALYSELIGNCHPPFCSRIKSKYFGEC